LPETLSNLGGCLVGHDIEISNLRRLLALIGLFRPSEEDSYGESPLDGGRSWITWHDTHGVCLLDRTCS
jgi:hypothetical protein